MSDVFPRLKSFVERVERIQGEIDAGNADKKEIYAEAKGTGFDVKIMKLLIAERRKDAATVAETSELLDLYRAAMNGTVHADIKPERAPAPARAEPITPHCADTGEIIESAPVAEREPETAPLAAGEGPAPIPETDAGGGDVPRRRLTPSSQTQIKQADTTPVRSGVPGKSPEPVEDEDAAFRRRQAATPSIPDFLRRAQPQGNA